MPSEQRAPEQVALLDQYHELLQHNELALASDTLEELKHLVPCRGRFLGDLESAAANRGLVDKFAPMGMTLSAC